MSHLVKPSSRQFFDKARPNPKLPPRNLSPSIQGDQRCSSPNCPNFATTRCNFCELHCRKIHHGIHYRYKSKTERKKVIEDLINKYLPDDKLGDK